MKELLKNLVASTPLAISVVLTYTIQPVLFIAKLFAKSGIYLHETLETKLGIEITKKKIEIMQAEKQMQELKSKFDKIIQESKQNDSSEDDSTTRLANIVKPATNNDIPAGGNVFILNKKGTNNESKD